MKYKLILRAKNGEFTLYKRRFVLLVIYCFADLADNFILATFSGIAPKICAIYGIKTIEVKLIKILCIFKE